MKTFLSVAFGLLCALASNSQEIGNSAPYRGEYIGVCLPSPKCSNERLIISFFVSSDGTLTGAVLNYDGGDVFAFDAKWPYFDAGRFNSEITGLSNQVVGKFNSKSGTVSGVVKVSNGCAYTFKAQRRFRVAQ